MVKSLGVFEIGYEKVELKVDNEDFGGSFSFLDDKSNTSVITIGIASNDWRDVIKVILHESYEYAFSRSRTRFSATEDLSNDHSEYLFVFNHPTFSHCCGIVSDFICNTNTKIYTEWQKAHEKGKKRG